MDDRLGLRRLIEGLLDGGGVVRLPVARGFVVPDINDAGANRGRRGRRCQKSPPGQITEHESLLCD